MSRRFSIQILLPIEGYCEDILYKKKDIVEFAKYKYSLKEMDDYSIYPSYMGEYDIIFQGNRYLVEEFEVKQLEKEKICESIYCNELKDCRFSWFYTSAGDELVPNDIAIVDDELIQKALDLLGYETEKDLTNCLINIVENKNYGEDKFIASLVLAKEIAKRVNGRAVLKYD